MTAVAGLRGTGNWGTDERPKNFREMILWRNPNGNSPITAFLGRLGSERVNDPEFSWWDEPNDIIRLQVNGAVTTTGATVVVDSADPSTSSPANVWGEANHLVPGDLLQVEKAEETTYDNEILMVSSVTSSTSFVVRRAQAGSSAATIDNDAFLLKVGSAFGEGTAEPNAASRNPIKYFNYTQIFKHAYEVTRTASQTKTRTGDVLKNERDRKMFIHSAALELAFLFGRRSEGNDPVNGKPLRTTGGLRSFIPAATTTLFTTTPTTTTFLDAVFPVFNFDTRAGDQRIVLCGNGFLNGVNKLAQAAGTVNYGDVVTLYGMRLREYILPQGSLFLRTHPLLNRNTRYTNSAFILDPTSMKYRFMMDTKFEDNIQAKGEDLVKGQWITECGLEIAYGGLTCGYLGNFVVP